jgi:hypothetical protein
MPRISELESQSGSRTGSNDLFVTVDIEAGDFGTKNITRQELVTALQQENFGDIRITGGYIQSASISNAVIEGSVIANTSITSGNISDVSLSEFDIQLSQDIQNLPPPPDSYFVIKDVLAGQTAKITFAELQLQISTLARKATKIYVDPNGDDGNGSYNSPFNTIENAVIAAQQSEIPVAISLLPGEYTTDGNLALPDNCSIVSTNGQYSTTFTMKQGSETNNCILVGSGCYVQGISFKGLRVDNFDNPTTGFAIAFRPGALIVRSPYIRDISQISNYARQNIAAPLNPRNSLGGLDDLGGTDFPNPLVGRGGGVLLADRAVLNQNSIFPYMLAFGATPRSPNGIGYVAKNGAGINGISSLTIFQRCAFYALNGGQITLNNSGTQFGDISMRAKGSIPVTEPYETNPNLLLPAPATANLIDANQTTIIDDMWNYLVNSGYAVNETFTRRDAANLLQSISYDVRTGNQTSTRNFVAGLFDYKADHVFSVFNPATTGLTYKGSVATTGALPATGNLLNDAYIVYTGGMVPLNVYIGNVHYWNGSAWVNAGPNNTTLLQAFIDSYDFILAEIQDLTVSIPEKNMMAALFNDILKATLLNPRRLNFGSLIESIGHQFNLAGAGVNKNALPLNFRRVGKPLPASGSVLQQDGGRVRWSGADELNNQYFARGLRINGRTGRLEGRPFTSSVRRLARRAANSRTL